MHLFPCAYSCSAEARMKWLDHTGNAEFSEPRVTGALGRFGSGIGRTVRLPSSARENSENGSAPQSGYVGGGGGGDVRCNGRFVPPEPDQQG